MQDLSLSDVPQKTFLTVVFFRVRESSKFGPVPVKRKLRMAKQNTIDENKLLQEKLEIFKSIEEQQKMQKHAFQKAERKLALNEKMLVTARRLTMNNRRYWANLDERVKREQTWIGKESLLVEKMRVDMERVMKEVRQVAGPVKDIM